MITLFPASQQHPRGYTIIELLIGMVTASVIIAGVYILAYTGVLVTVKSFSLNSTASASRLAVDRMLHELQSAYEPPTFINASGANVTGNGPAAGVRFYRFIGSPYVVQIPTAGLPGTATQIDIVFDRRAMVVPPVPQRDDALVINTTILMSGQGNQVRALVQSASVINTANNRTTVRVQLKRALTGYATVLPNDGTTVTATLIRPTAFLVRSAPNDGQELVMLESFPETSPINLRTAGPILVSHQIEKNNSIAGDSNQPFQRVEVDGRAFMRINLQVRDRRYHNYLADREPSDVASYVALETQTAFKCDPDPYIVRTPTP